MIEKTCRCGKTKKNFVVDIGPFFMDECCIEAGYDHLGNKPLEAADVGLTPEEVAAVTPESTQNLEIVDEGEQPDPQEEVEQSEEAEETEKVEETPEQAKARKKAEKEAKKAAKKAKQA